jgi:RNA polymerase sigma-70 factor, ECF subfamily
MATPGPDSFVVGDDDSGTGLNPRGLGGRTPMLATLSLITPTTGRNGHESYHEIAVLVRRAQSGDREALGRLVEQFQPTVHALCLRRLGNPSEALELTQEVFLHVMRRIDQLREPERFAGWLRQVAVRMAINRATRRTAPPSVETGVLEGAAAFRDNPLDSLISRERAERLHEGLSRLKNLDRETLVAFYIHGQSLIEMAERLDVPLGTVKRRLHTARKRLKAELQAVAADADEWTDSADDEPEDDADLDESELVGAGAGRSGW